MKFKAAVAIMVAALALMCGSIFALADTGGVPAEAVLEQEAAEEIDRYFYLYMVNPNTWTPINGIVLESTWLADIVEVTNTSDVQFEIRATKTNGVLGDTVLYQGFVAAGWYRSFTLDYWSNILFEVRIHLQKQKPLPVK